MRHRPSLLAAVAFLALALVGGLTHSAAANERGVTQVVLTDSGPLFEVTLRPGETAYRSAILHNTGTTPASVTLIPAVFDAPEDQQVARDLRIHVGPGAPCDESAAAAGVSLSGARIPVGDVPPTASLTICIAVTLAADSQVADGATAVVDLAFDSIAAPAPDTSGALAITGGMLPFAFLAATIALTLSGALSLFFGRRRQHLKTPGKDL